MMMRFLHSIFIFSIVILIMLSVHCMFFLVLLHVLSFVDKLFGSE